MKMIIDQKLNFFKPNTRYGQKTLDIVRAKGDIKELEGAIEECLWDRTEYDVPTADEISEALETKREFIAQYLGYSSWDEYVDD